MSKDIVLVQPQLHKARQPGFINQLHFVQETIFYELFDLEFIQIDRNPTTQKLEVIPEKRLLLFRVVVDKSHGMPRD